MKISYLQEFAVLAGCLSYSTAARQLHVSQSALSKHIAALEADLGVELFTRNTHSVALTASGEDFIEYAQSIVSSYENARKLFHRTAATRSQFLVGGLVDSPGEFALVARATEYLQVRHPDRSVHFLPSTAVPVNAQIANGELDCAITSYEASSPSFESGLELSYVPVASMPFHAILAADHPLAARSELHLADLEGQSLIRISGGRFSNGWQCIRRALDRHGVNVHLQFYPMISINDYLNVALEDNIFILPKIEMRANEIKNPDRVVLPIVDEDAVFGYGVLYLRNSSKTALIEDFAVTLKRVIEETYVDSDVFRPMAIALSRVGE